MTKQEECNIKLHLPDDIVKRVQEYCDENSYISFEICLNSLIRELLDQRDY